MSQPAIFNVWRNDPEDGGEDELVAGKRCSYGIISPATGAFREQQVIMGINTNPKDSVARS